MKKHSKDILFIKRDVKKNPEGRFFLEENNQPWTFLSELAVKAMKDEVKLSPKPGLVDAFNSGSHRDMDLDMFLKSADALRNYFSDLVRHSITQYKPGRSIYLDDYTEKRGKKALYEMYFATDNVNTHKGAIFTMGLFVLAATEIYLRKGRYPLEEDMDELKVLLKINGFHHFRNFFENTESISAIENEDFTSIGMRMRKLYNMGSIIEEATEGYPSVLDTGYGEYVKCKNLGYSEKRSLLSVLFKIMSTLTDTNVLKRGGEEGLQFVQKSSENLLSSGENLSEKDFLSKIKDLDREFIKKNISPGGSADLMMAVIFLKDLMLIKTG